MKVQLKNAQAPDGVQYWSLTLGNVYEVLGIEGDWLRLLDDIGDPVLFDPACFDVIDGEEPGHWQSNFEEERERYAYPPEWNHAGFFEDFHDGVPEAVEVFWSQLRRYYPDFDRR